MAKVELRADRKTGGLSSFLTEGAFRGLFTERQGRAFLRGSYPGACIPPALTQTELSARLVSARIPHIRGEVVTANFLELFKGEVRILGILRSSLSAYRTSTGPEGILQGVQALPLLTLLAREAVQRR
jgi:hypothetical protein